MSSRKPSTDQNVVGSIATGRALQLQIAQKCREIAELARQLHEIESRPQSGDEEQTSDATAAAEASGLGNFGSDSESVPGSTSDAESDDETVYKAVKSKKTGKRRWIIRRRGTTERVAGASRMMLDVSKHS